MLRVRWRVVVRLGLCLVSLSASLIWTPAARADSLVGGEPAGTPQAVTEPSTPDCTPQSLVGLAGVQAPNPRLNALAAASFARVRAELMARTGADVLATLADALRAPAFHTNKPGVSDYSWHKAGRAIDLNLGGPFTLQRDGALIRVFVGDVDLTAIFEANGWNRIPAQQSVAEWWHYEYHPDGISWQSAMAQVWPVDALKQAFPELDWDTLSCTTSSSLTDVGMEAPANACVPDPPIWGDGAGVSYSHGCGPAVLPPGLDRAIGTRLRQFEGAVGWLGQTGRLIPPGPAGVHLHLGLDTGSWTDMCRWPNQVAGVAEEQPPPGAYACLTNWADPLQYLPQANGDTLTLAEQTPVPVEAGHAGDVTLSDAVVQLPPPGHPAGLLLPPPDAQSPGGTWWSPGNDERARQGRCPLGGPQAASWLDWVLALVFPWLFGC